MSTPREIIKKTLSFDCPERVARSFSPSDFVWAHHTAATYASQWQKDPQGRWFSIDEWGNRWSRLDDSSKGEVVESVLPSIAQIESYQFPDFSRPADYQSVHKARLEHPDHWLIGALPGFTFNIARKMRRIDQYLLELAMEPAAIHRLNDRVDEVLATMISQYAKAGVDCVMFPEDWGTQRQTLISPTMWRREFFPRFQRLCDLAHHLKIKVFMHSCGQIAAIIPDLISAGIDLLQFDQPDLHGIDQLANYQKESKITFWCPVDIQKTLQTRDEAIIRSKSREMLDKLWQGRGGFVAGYYEDNQSIGLEPAWQGFASETFLQFGVSARYQNA